MRRLTVRWEGWRNALALALLAVGAALTARTITGIRPPPAYTFALGATNLALIYWLTLGAGWAVLRAVSVRPGVSRRHRVIAAAAIGWCVLVSARPALRSGDGLTAQYFAVPDTTGLAILATAEGQPSTSQLEAHGLPSSYSAIWTGFVTVPRTADYFFATTSDDESWLFIDNALVVDNGGGPHSRRTRDGRVTLTGGSHRVTLRYIQYGGDYRLSLAFAAPGGQPRSVPAWMLSRGRTTYSLALTALVLDSATTCLTILLVLVTGVAAIAQALAGASTLARAALGAPGFASADGRPEESADATSSRGHAMTRAPVALGLIWLIATGVNLTKAFHIDDTAYVEIATWISAHPLHPMLGSVFWSGASEPISSLNQPHLVFYLMAIWMRLFGSSEIAQHLLLSLFTLGGILLFDDLSRTVLQRRSPLPTALLFLGPAFLPSQNMMVDVPLLFFWLSFFWGIAFAARHHDSQRGFVIAGLAASAGLMTKYSSIVLVPVLLFFIWRVKRFIAWYTVLLPIVTIAAWSWFNYWDYGQIHILDRPRPSEFSNLWQIARRAVPEWLIALGGVAPLLAMSGKKVFRGPFAVCAVAAVTFGAWTSWHYMRLVETESAAVHSMNAVLALVVAANGAWVLCSAAGILMQERGRTVSRVDTEWMVIWLGGSAAFVCLFAPFMATRHVLLSLPPIILALCMTRRHATHTTGEVFTLVFSVCLGLVLAASDWHYADVYRTSAREIRADMGATRRVWFTGHWGWQWYAKVEHMLPYEPGRSVLTPGDVMVEPRLVDSQGVTQSDRQRLHPLMTIEAAGTGWTLARTMSASPFGGLYYNTGFGLPWKLSHQPLDVFRLSVVDQVP